ncbi:MAG: hypothetical protein R6X33_07145 [Candidatus Brocadiia bacterium]
MKKVRWKPAVIVVALAAAGMAALAAPGGTPAANQPASAPAPGGAMQAWQFIARFKEERHDVTGIARQALDLSAEQRAELQRLARQKRKEEARLLEQLRKDYAQKVRDVLDEPQRARYDGVMSALDELAEETAAAASDFMEAVGADEEQHPLAPGERLSMADPTKFLDVDEATRRKLLRLRVRKHRTLSDALRGMPRREELEDPAAWKGYREKYRELERKAEQDYEAELKEILSEEQLERFRKVEAAVEEYRERIQAAQREAFEKIHGALTSGEET